MSRRHWKRTFPSSWQPVCALLSRLACEKLTLSLAGTSSGFSAVLTVGHKVDPRETAKKTAVKGPTKKKKRTGARNVSKLTNVHLLEKVRPIRDCIRCC